MFPYPQFQSPIRQQQRWVDPPPLHHHHRAPPPPYPIPQETDPETAALTKQSMALKANTKENTNLRTVRGPGVDGWGKGRVTNPNPRGRGGMGRCGPLGFAMELHFILYNFFSSQRTPHTPLRWVRGWGGGGKGSGPALQMTGDQPAALVCLACVRGV